MKKISQMMAAMALAFALLISGFQLSHADPVEITNWTELDNVRNNLAGDYILMNPLDEATPGYAGLGDDWTPIGTDEDPFTGTFDGDGHTISGLTMDLPIRRSGLFGAASGAEIKNLGVVDADITTSEWLCGVLVGRALNSTIENCFSTGTIYDINEATESAHFGGLIGQLSGGTVTDSWSSVDIESTGWMIGGLIGTVNSGGVVERTYATGNLSGNRWVAGHTAQHGGSSVIRDSYATGNTTGVDDVNPTRVGGFVAFIWRLSTIENSYSTGEPSGVTEVGGFIGHRNELGEDKAIVNDCFWDTESSDTEVGVGEGETVGLEGKDTADMKTEATFTAAGWDFTDIWAIDAAENEGYPYLQAFEAPDPDPDPDPDPTKITEIPWSEDFSDADVPDLPEGWANIGDVVTFDGWTEIGGTTLEFPLGIAEDDHRIAVLPEIDEVIDISALKLEFNVQTPSIVGDERIEVGFLTDPADPATFTLIESVSLLAEGAVLDAEVSLAGHVEGNGRFLALKAESPSDWNRFFIGYVELTDAPVASDKDMHVPQTLELAQNYPNPFNPVTAISYELPKNSDVTLAVYNVTGQKVATLVDAYQNAGSHTVNFDASEFSSGVYIYQLRAGNQVLTRQMTLVK